ncbi:hypothetical protein MYSTI_07913 [Myxococcus stipitatus DSM 14675]|uniref:Lipoprotein n=1 Tax=Myxococcus stipitatus (strain DSM 14675 / JCM 12634 / Mx s8) TaxID=1278073 RepID=L7UMR8_MYXSD|nr:hypothetical protein [Myxococcus stipitatus]AGC49185.1 hypothetical protein MYSTI_07913 [Myxococcus stipitatus DSM 14675]
MASMRNLLFALPLATFTVACGGEPLEPTSPEAASPVVADEAVDQVEQRVGLQGPYNWHTSANGYVSTSIGTATNRTCFLTGVSGNLQPPTGSSSWGSTGTFVFAGEWYIFVNHNFSKMLGSTVECMTTAANRTAEVSWYNGQAAKLLGAVTADRRCFLTMVEGSGAFDSTSEYVRVWNDGLNWYLGGDLAGEGGGRALCVDVPESHGGWQWISAGSGFSKELAYNPGGVGCFLSGLGGRFNQNSLTDGLSIDYNSGTRTWEMTLSPAKRGWANCVK